MFDIEMPTICLIALTISFSCNSPRGMKEGPKMKQEPEEAINEEKMGEEKDDILINVAAEIEVFLPEYVTASGSMHETIISIPGTQLKITAPREYKGKTIVLCHGGSPVDISEKWKSKKQEVQFKVSERRLLDQFRKGGQWLYTVDLKGIRWLDEKGDRGQAP